MAKKPALNDKAVAGTLDLLKTINPEQATQEHAQETVDEIESLFHSAAHILEENKKQAKMTPSKTVKKAKS